MISMISPSRLAKRWLMVGSALSAALFVGLGSARAQAVAVPPYVLTGFTGVAPSGATQPDDLSVSADGASLWIDYGNGACTTGTGCPSGVPISSNVVEYNIGTRAVVLNVSIPGHVDGLKINPRTGDVWATENEDGNPTLTVVNPKTGKFKTYTFDSSLPFDGGMDDLVFSGKNSKNLYIVMSSQSAISAPVIAQFSAGLKKTNTKLTSTLSGDPGTVWNVVTNSAETGDMIGDPDSMTIDPAGELILDNRSDLSLYVVRAPGVSNAVLRVPLTLSTSGSPMEVNDTIFTTSTAGTIFITDTSSNTIYTLTKPYFPANEVYTAANKAGVVGLVDMNTGIVTPVVTRLEGPHGLAFSPLSVAIAPVTTK
ncbi:MAG: hypothetical protein ACREQT_15685 [Candidatus Binataceae bacterium]